ncbi:hypothetical protein JNG75_15300 [Proteus mirabilis]|nr:hypothetical protein [Proteus mirabilis]
MVVLQTSTFQHKTGKVPFLWLSCKRQPFAKKVTYPTDIIELINIYLRAGVLQTSTFQRKSGKIPFLRLSCKRQPFDL